VDRGWLGVQIQPVTDAIASAIGLPGTDGALVAGVQDDAPAASVLRSGDVILSFNGNDVKQSRDLPRIVGRTTPQTAVPVRVFRDGLEQTVMVTVGLLKV
jgi:serine protease Do